MSVHVREEVCVQDPWNWQSADPEGEGRIGSAWRNATVVAVVLFCEISPLSEVSWP